jgi:hypothetical protein
MQPILTRIEIVLDGGPTLFNTTDLNDLSNLEIAPDKEGFPGRHLNVGTQFQILENEQGNEGKYRVVRISTFIQDDPVYGKANSIGGAYEWGVHIIYVVERV